MRFAVFAFTRLRGSPLAWPRRTGRFAVGSTHS